MSNELALAANNPTALNKLFGFESKPKPVIPYLKVNGSDDGDGSSAPKGTFVLDDGETVLYADTVTIRSFVKAYQYRIFDPADASKNDSSTIENSFKHEFRSVSGRLACGKMSKRGYLELGESASPTQQYLQKNVKCKLLVFGLVSGAFTNLDTKAPVEVKDALFSWTVSQSGFMAIDQAITGIHKERRAVPLTPIKITLKKEKSGSVTYFVPIPNVLNETAPFDAAAAEEHLKKISGFIKDNNDYVNKKYNEATKAKQENDNFGTVGEILDNMSREMTDDVIDL